MNTNPIAVLTPTIMDGQVLRPLVPIQEGQS